MIRDFLARDFLAHRVTFRDFMARNFLARDFLGGYHYRHFTDVKDQDESSIAQEHEYF